MMDKLEQFFQKEKDITKRKDWLDRVMWLYGKWIIAISLPFYPEMRWYKNMAHPNLWIWLIIAFVWAFCVLFCFGDIYLLYKKIK